MVPRSEYPVEEVIRGRYGGLFGGQAQAPFLRTNHRLASSIVHFVDHFLAGRLRGLLPEEKRYWLLVPVTGVVAGLLAVLLVVLLKSVHELCWESSENVGEQIRNAHELKRVLIPTAGGLLVACYVHWWRRGTDLEGTAGLIEALSVGRGRLPALRTYLTSFVSIFAVGMGASVGREGALINSGAASGSWLGTAFRLRDHHVKVLLACGAAGGMAASYNVPIGATVFAMEVLLGSLALDLFGPIIVCSVIATAISRALLPSTVLYEIPDVLTLESEWEILVYLALGVVIGVVAVGFIRVFTGLKDLFRWLDRLRSLRPLVAMLILGVVGIWFPDLFGNGYDTVNGVLRDESDPTANWIHFLVLLPVLKILLTALCRAGDVPGGLFTPSLFVGALLGYSFGLGVAEAFSAGTIAPPQAYAMVAMGAMVAGTLHAPITGILMLFEMTQDYAMILPLMSACIASALTSRMLQPASLYTEPLRRKGIVLPDAKPPIWLRQPTVGDILTPEVETVHAAEPFHQVMEAFLRSPQEQDRLYVIRQDRTYLGVVSLHEIKAFFRGSEHFDTVIAADIMNTYFPVVYVDDPMSSAVELLAESDAERLPVLENPQSRKLLGSVSKRDLLVAYREANLARVKRP